MTVQKAPTALKRWFVVHFAADVIFAVPLFLFPKTFLSFLGWQVVDPFATRIVAAALFGIGIESLLGRNADVQTFKNMLNLKIIWSGATILGVGLTLLQMKTSPALIHWLVLATFSAFHILWVKWRIQIIRYLN